MANKFQKSVLERLEQEAARQKQKPREKTEDRESQPVAAEMAVETPVSVPVKNTEADNEQTETEIQQDRPSELQIPAIEPETTAIPDIGGYLIREPQRSAKNKTFYLDGDVIDAVKAAARSQNVTDSKLVNDILRRVLGLQ